MTRFYKVNKKYIQFCSKHRPNLNMMSRYLESRDDPVNAILHLRSRPKHRFPEVLRRIEKLHLLPVNGSVGSSPHALLANEFNNDIVGIGEWSDDTGSSLQDTHTARAILEATAMTSNLILGDLTYDDATDTP